LRLKNNLFAFVETVAVTFHWTITFCTDSYCSFEAVESAFFCWAVCAVQAYTQDGLSSRVIWVWVVIYNMHSMQC